jgi:hypothetical protein
MSTFKCGLRRFDGHGAKERPVNTEATREMESALERLRRSREAQDTGTFVIQQVAAVQPVSPPLLKKGDEIPGQKDPPVRKGELSAHCYSLSDANR